MPGKKSRFWKNEKARAQVLSGIVVALMVLTAFTGLFLMSERANAAWNVPGDYSTHYKITINNGGSALTNYQIKLTLNSSNVDYSHWQSANGYDILFTNADNTTNYNYYIQTWNTGGDSIVWVNVTSIPNGNSIMYMHCNQSGITSDHSNFDGTFIKSYASDSNLDVQLLMDDGSGTTVSDSSGNNHDGTMQGETTWVGSEGGQWDGSSSTRFSSGDSIDFNSTLGPHLNISVDAPATGSWEIWYKPQSLPSGDTNDYILCRDDSGTNSGDSAIAVRHVDDTFIAFGTDSSAKLSLNTNVTAVVGNWYYLALTYDGSTLKFYVNGELKNSTSINMPTLGNSGIDMYLSNFNPSTDYHIDGVLDNFRQYSRVLPADEISRHYYCSKYASTAPAISAITEVSGGETLPSAPTGVTATAYTNFDITLAGYDANSRYNLSTFNTNDTVGDTIWSNSTTYGIMKVTNAGIQQINLSWTKGTGATNTYIRRDTTSHATWTLTTGSELANTTDNYYNLGSSSPGTHYYYALWSWNSSGYSGTYATCDAIVGNASVTNLTIHIEDGGTGTALLPKENITLYGNGTGSFASLGAFDATTGNITLTSTYAGLPLAIGDNLYFEYKSVIGPGAQPNGTYYDKNAETLDCYVYAER